MTQHDTRLHSGHLAPHLQTQLDACSTVTDQCVLLERLATHVERQMQAQLGWLRRERQRRVAMLPTDVTWPDDGNGDDVTNLREVV